VAAQPDNARAWFNLSLIHDKRNDLPAALKAIEQALKLQPGNPLFLQAKASFLRKTN